MDESGSEQAARTVDQPRRWAKRRRTPATRRAYSRAVRCLIVCLGLAVAGAPAAADPVHVLVYADRDGDGKHGAGEPPVPGVVVAVGTTAFAVTDEHGVAWLEEPAGGHGVIWARVPDGYAPGPAWSSWLATGRAEIAVQPLAEPVPRPLRIAVASDTHLAATQPFALDLGAAARAAVRDSPAPSLLVLLGDITQGGRPEQVALVDAELEGLGVPVVRVPGNHDWYDGGDAWTQRSGPDNFSFDFGGAHFVAWNMALTDPEIVGFVRADLARVDRAALTVVALTHAPPSPAVAAALRELGVTAVLTGHLHGNRAVDHDGMRELSTEPLLMGGIDGTPAGYRILEIGAAHAVRSEHHVTLDAPYVGITSPGAGQCVVPGAASELLVAASAVDVTARIDCGTPIALRSAGGWTARGVLPPLAAGVHTLEVEVRAADGEVARAPRALAVCIQAAPPAAPTLPRVQRWATSVGGHVLTAAPVIAGDLVYVVTTDLADGDAGGVVALELATGAIRWRVPSAVPVRGAVALAGTTLVLAPIDGTLLGLDAATGAERWRADVAGASAPPASALFAGPTAEGDDVFVGGQRRLVAIDARTGAEQWAMDPIPAALAWVDFAVLAPVAVGRGLVIGTFAREQSGLVAVDRATGRVAWRVDESSAQPTAPGGTVDTLAVGIAGAPVIVGDTVYIATSADEVAALEVDTGAVRWRTSLDPRGFDWGAAILGTPAYARGILVVPTLYEDAVAVDAASGAVLWRHAGAGPGPLRVTHYRGAGETGYAASPVVADDVVWLAGTDGTLVALALETGAELVRVPLGAPVLAGLAIRGDTLVVASFDGTVRALGPGTPAEVVAAPQSCGAEPVTRGGGCCDGGAGGGPAGVSMLAAVALGRRKRGRRRSSQR